MRCNAAEVLHSVDIVPHSGTKPALGEPFRIGEGCSFHSFRTNNYKLHFMESPSGFKVTRLMCV